METSSSSAKRPRVQQLARRLPNTPNTEAARPSLATPGTATTTNTDVDTPTQKVRGKSSPIWDYYIRISMDASKNQVCECRACGKMVKGRSTSNFRDHQRLGCTGLLAWAAAGGGGIVCALPKDGVQSTIEKDSGALVQPFNHRTFLSAVIKWIVVSGLPFTAIQNPHLQKAFLLANPEARLQSARTLARRLEDVYDVVNNKVLQVIRKVGSTLHYSHDCWTDSGRKNAYFGIYVSYINPNTFEYQECLLRLLHMRGRHTGERMGRGVYDLFNDVVGVTTLGPGTADNASNNRAAADRVAELFRLEEGLEQGFRLEGSDLVGCMCHIANIAALQYINAEGKYSGMLLQKVGNSRLTLTLCSITRSGSVDICVCLRSRERARDQGPGRERILES